ncbi:hypothetical protein [Vibrio pelagius]|uniref:hypothetical protein n=1 Tax=Vibrio pelagius TaxID=28169 RepID=UPI00354E45B5
MITLPASLHIEKIEDVIHKICTENGNQELELTVSSKGFAFGGYAAAVQAVNTWASNNIDRELVVKESDQDIEEQLSNIIKAPHKFTAAMMAKAIFLSKETKRDVRKDIYSLAKLAVENQSNNTYGQNRGRLCWYSFVDHSTKGFDRNFYLNSKSRTTQIQNIEQITNIVCSMVNKSSSVAGGAEFLDKDDTNDIGRLFFELFVNTHEHGSRDKNRNTWLKPATRLIYTYGINLSDSAVKNSIGNNEVLEDYFLGVEGTSRSNNRFIEISIVDSGLGYSGRWLADNPEDGVLEELSIVEEYEILKKCFRFRSTSSNNLVKGNGLPAIMSMLTRLNGFMRIRSNRLSLYRDFISQPFNNDNYDFMDWDSKEYCNKSITPKADVTGVLVTILIPLVDKEDMAGK